MQMENAKNVLLLKYGNLNPRRHQKMLIIKQQHPINCKKKKVHQDASITPETSCLTPNENKLNTVDINSEANVDVLKHSLSSGLPVEFLFNRKIMKHQLLWKLRSKNFLQQI